MDGLDADAEGVKHVSPGQRPGESVEYETSQPCRGRNNHRDKLGVVTMPQSLAKNTVHLVFSTKNRFPWLKESLRPRLYAYLAGIFEKWESPAIVIGGHDDHVHALFLLSKNHPLKRIVEEAKKGSSKWIKSLATELAEFSWQNGYGAFSVSESNVAEVRKYIEHQDDHHRRMTFQDELRQLCARHKIAVDERFVWS